MRTADLLVDVSPIDPLTHGMACAVVVSAALAATFIPARRASRLDPWRALRDE
jgi:ABC-type lipoprotein release transport system permease subunit